MLWHLPGDFDLIGVIRHTQKLNELPVTVSLTVFLELQFDPGEVGNHALKVGVYDPADMPIAQADYRITVGMENLNQMIPLILGLQVAKNGTYKFILEQNANRVNEKTVIVDSSSSPDPIKKNVVGFRS